MAESITIRTGQTAIVSTAQLSTSLPVIRTGATIIIKSFGPIALDDIGIFASILLQNIDTDTYFIIQAAGTIENPTIEISTTGAGSVNNIGIRNSTTFTVFEFEVSGDDSNPVLSIVESDITDESLIYDFVKIPFPSTSDYITLSVYGDDSNPVFSIV